MRIRHMVCPSCGLLLSFFQFTLEVLEPGLGNIACLKTLKVLFCVFFRDIYCFTLHIYITGSSEERVVCPMSYKWHLFFRGRARQLYFHMCLLPGPCSGLWRTLCSWPSIYFSVSVFLVSDFVLMSVEILQFNCFSSKSSWLFSFFLHFCMNFQTKQKALLVVQWDLIEQICQDSYGKQNPEVLSPTPGNPACHWVFTEHCGDCRAGSRLAEFIPSCFLMLYETITVLFTMFYLMTVYKYTVGLFLLQ